MTISTEYTTRLIAEFAERLSACMTRVSVDTAGLAARSGIAESRIADILAATVEVNASELAMFAVALDVLPSEILPTLRDL